MTRTYAIGDTHGCLSQLQNLIEECEKDAGEGQSRFVFLGDYIDRGPDSRGVLDLLIDLQKWSPDEIICLLGNHEDMLLAAIADEANEARWLRNGGDQTLLSFRVTRAIDIPDKYQTWLRSLPKFFDDGRRFFVHAGIHPDRPLDQQDEHDLLWIREPFLSDDRDYGRVIIVHGHTPIRSGLPDQRPNRLNLDTGAVFGRPLTAAVFTDENTAPERFLTAEPVS
jgi:serine/threonine protein phosphatase 1